MDIGKYRMYLQQYIQEAYDESDGSKAGISSYLWEKKVTGLMVRDKKEKEAALQEAKRIFDQNRHWPLEIILSYLGVELNQRQGT